MQYIKKICYFILGLCMCFGFLGSIKHISVYARMMTDITRDHSYWIVIGTVILLFLMTLFSNYIQKKAEHIKGIEKVLWGMLIFVELIFLYFFYCYPTSDSAEVVNGAIELANGNHGYLAKAAYFQKYKNNNLLTIITSWIYGISQFLLRGKTDYVLLNYLLNMLFMNGSVYLGYKVIKKVRGEIQACQMLFLAVLNPVQYMAIFWYYSATISTFFSMLLLFVAVRETKTAKQRVIKSIIIGVLTAIGYSLRPTVAITTIAIFIVGMAQRIGKKEMLSYLSSVCISVLCTCVCILSIHVVSVTYIPEQKETYPITHWISMGLEGDGTNSSYGTNYPDKVCTRNQRIEYDKNRMKKNLSQYQISSFARHIGQK